MISVCIPVYNFNITSLVDSLSLQIDELKLGIELVVIDDASDVSFINQNKACLTNHTYIKLPKNVGRAKIRNLFKNYAKNDYLLFLDCDSALVDHQFLFKYIKLLKKDSVIYGGRIYPEKLPSSEQKLSWAYGVNVESKSADLRSEKPYISFMTNNFVIDKSVFDKVIFDDTLKIYGHEDTFFAYELSKREINIIHVDNPILNIDIETNSAFVKKNKDAVKNLIQICSSNKESDFYEFVTLLKFEKKLNPFKRQIIVFFFLLLGSSIEYLLKRGVYSLRLLNFYKIGYLLHNKLD